MGGPIPLHLETIASELRRPETISHYRHTGVDLHHVEHALHRFSGTRVEGHRPAAEYRATHDGGYQHVIKPHILTELGAAIDLGRGVEARHRLAEYAKLLRVFQKHGRGDRQGCGLIGQRAIGQLTVTVATPCPISELPTMTVTVSSLAIFN